MTTTTSLRRLEAAGFSREQAEATDARSVVRPAPDIKLCGHCARRFAEIRRSDRIARWVH